MKEIRIHGRGGQGSVTAAELLAVAAFEDGYYSQAFPVFGVERRGAPVMAFTRIDEKPIRIRYQVYNPDYVMVQDPTLIPAGIDVLAGIKPGGLVIVNTARKPEEVGLKAEDVEIMTINATKIALKHIGRPITNTTMLGAFAGATGLVSLESVLKAIEERFSGKLREVNVAAIKEAYETIRGEVNE
ncbi:MAG: pyruvate ferredoxin oxidoreductase gamma subunit [Archaeoglobi archaeon]|nr:pyruvate ferredoxin oxidoreductase subunit gamma [Candidatus Mnemosynella bozhongmuii]MDK2781414.1 pyruvate ferredoxin oxidoreductase gamma subunit [Archaeoglobi archaeon]